MRQSTEAPALACTPSAGGDELVVTKKSAPVSTLPIGTAASGLFCC